MPAFFVAILFIFQAILILIHIAAYRTLVAAFGIGSPALEVVFAFLSVTFIIASILAVKFDNKFVRWYYSLSAHWFGLINFIFAGGVFFVLGEWIFSSFNYYVPLPLLGGICFGALVLIYIWSVWNSWRAEITSVTVKLSNLPDFWDGKKIVFVSDLHLGDIRAEGFAAKVTRKINALAPEAIFIGGDLYDGPKCDVVGIIEPLRALKAKQGTYFITGNHEYYLADVKKAFGAIKDIGIKILDNEKIDLHGIEFIGLDFETTHKADQLKKVLSDVKIDHTKLSVLLKHEPNDLKIAEEAGISLHLSGHTHRGQIYPITYVTRRIYKGFDYGLKPLGSMQVLTSSGVGTWGPPMRLGTKSEIVEITLRKKQ